MKKAPDNEGKDQWANQLLSFCESVGKKKQLVVLKGHRNLVRLT